MKWTEQHTKIKQGAGESRLDKELAFLFGADRLKQSRQMDIADMWAEADMVAAGARMLRDLMGNPKAQRELIAGMSDSTALALCKWIGET